MLKSRPGVMGRAQGPGLTGGEVGGGGGGSDTDSPVRCRVQGLEKS